MEAQISAELLEQAQRMVLSTQAPVASTSLPLVPPGGAPPVAPPPVSPPPAVEDRVQPVPVEPPAPELPDEPVEAAPAADAEAPAAEAPETEPPPAEVVKEPEGPAVITVSDSVTVRDLSEKLGVKSKVLIKELFSRGVMATINRSLDRDTIQQLCDLFEIQVEFVSEQEALVRRSTSSNVRRTFGRGPRSSPSWATSTTERPRSWTPFENHVWPNPKPGGSRSISAPTMSPSTAARSSFSTRRATRPSP